MSLKEMPSQEPERVMGKEKKDHVDLTRILKQQKDNEYTQEKGKEYDN